MRFVIALVVLSGCVFGGGQAAGEVCRADRECKSGRCYGGICDAGSCSNGDSSQCPSNYACKYDPGDPLFGTGAGYYCARTCDDGCPERWECVTQDQTCYFAGPLVTVTADVAAPVPDQPVTFTAAISPDLETTFAWRFEDIHGVPIGTTAMGETCVQAFPAGDYKALVEWATPGLGQHRRDRRPRLRDLALSVAQCFTVAQYWCHA